MSARKHGASQKNNEMYSEYQTWKAMKRRCFYLKDKHYKDYGARGITISKSWMSFENFIRDMGKRPGGYSLDRIDNNKNYEKSNCRWATKIQQGRNKRNVLMLEYNSKKIPAFHLAEINGIKRSTYSMRISKYGWSALDAATRKVRN